MREYYFEDFAVGDRHASTGVTLTEGEIIDFALRYDPQPFHIDTVAAANSLFGGLIASGFHTLALGFRMIFQTGIFEGGGAASPGMEALHWFSPVRPGDTIRTVAEVVETRGSNSKPDLGIVKMRFDVFNQRDEKVMDWTSVQLVRRR